MAQKALEIENGAKEPRRAFIGHLHLLLAEIQHQSTRKENTLQEWVDYADISKITYVIAAYEKVLKCFKDCPAKEVMVKRNIQKWKRTKGIVAGRRGEMQTASRVLAPGTSGARLQRQLD